MGLLDIFKTTQQAKQGQQQSLTSSQTQADSKQAGESYHNYGQRICALHNANIEILPVYFQRIYTIEKQRWIDNEEYQKAQKSKIQSEINDETTKLKQAQNQLNADEQERSNTNDSISESNGKIEELKRKDTSENKMHRVKFAIGTIILLLLTVYLFVFYSSTFYSAFFKDFFTADDNIGSAMFDASAIPQALQAGLGELVFICLAPIIFMALGYSLHYFNESESKIKFLKSGACIMVTFVFDCILAYLIGQNLYTVALNNTLEEMPPYSLSIAISDPNIWAVIFCGFITYMIWGIVLDMTLTAYADTQYSVTEIAKLKNHIASLKSKLESLAQRILSDKQTIDSINGRIQNLQVSMNMVHVPTNQIQSEISNFFAGWTNLATILNSSYNTSSAQNIFNNFIEQTK